MADETFVPLDVYDETEEIESHFLKLMDAEQIKGKSNEEIFAYVNKIWKEARAEVVTEKVSGNK